jgi:hypothetical protein
MEATMNIKRNLLIVSLLVVLVLPTSFAFAAGSEDVKGVNLSNCENYKFDQTISRSYSYDTYDDYGASLSGSEVDHVTSFPWEVAISFPCAEASVEINSFSANPELSVAQFTTDVSPVSAEINSFSANPELSVAQFTTDVSPASAEINTFSANPELMVAQRYAVAAPVSSEINSFSTNPELMVAQRYAVAPSVSAETKDCSADCYDNY